MEAVEAVVADTDGVAVGDAHALTIQLSIMIRNKQFARVFSILFPVSSS